jgi:hypothetical protein
VLDSNLFRRKIAMTATSAQIMIRNQQVPLDELFSGWTIIFPSISSCSRGIEPHLENEQVFSRRFSEQHDHFPLNWLELRRLKPDGQTSESL